MNLNLSIFEFQLRLFSDDAHVIGRLKNDFDHFVLHDDDLPIRKALTIRLFLQRPDYTLIPEIAALKQNSNCIIYQQEQIRFCDYYGEALSRYDFERNTAEFYAPSPDRLHEITYLFILSRVGKWMDLKGLHRLHASAVEIAGKVAVFMLPSKGGKSTLVQKMFQLNPHTKLISDDSPVFDSKGRLHPFLLRVGFEKEPSYDHMILERKNHGKKYLVSASHFNPVIDPFISNRPITFFFGKRSNKPLPTIRAASKLTVFKEMMIHGVIGLGLPIIIEYFLENHWRDHFRNAQILVRRLICFASLSSAHRGFEVEFSNNPELNAQAILDILNHEN